MNYSKIKFFDISNGDGLRTSVFVSGCKHACKGCFNKIAWDFNYGKFFSQQIQNEIINSCKSQYISGLSLLGGEPLDPINQISLLPFVRKFKQIYPTKTIWCYTGYTYESDLLNPLGNAHCEVTSELLNLIDILVDGKFIEELKDIKLKFKGSKNQRIINLKNGEIIG